MDGIIKFLYYNSPYFVQNIFCSIYGLNIKCKRYNYLFKRYLKESFLTFFFSASKLKKHHNNRLRILLKISNEHSIFWKQRFKKYNIDITKDDLINEIKKLPILTKKEVKENIEKILVKKKYLRSYTKSKLRKCMTSGTTGSGLIFSETAENDAMRWAIWWRYRYLIGIREDMWCGIFGGRSLLSPNNNRSPFWRINFPCKQVIFSTYHISDKNSISYLKELKRRAFKWIHGYPSALSLIAHYSLKYKIDISENLEIVTTGGENLFSHQKILMEKVFKAPVINHYGQAEGVANFSQIGSESYLVDEDYSIVEFIKSYENGKYKVIGTSLYNLAFPLIRYSTDDIVELSEENINFQDKWRVVDDIDGRSEDYLLLNDGSKVGRLDPIFKDLIEIVEAQFIQIEKGKAELLIVPSIGFNEKTFLKLNNLIYEKFGNRIEISIKKVDMIEKGKSGKLRLIKTKYKI